MTLRLAFRALATRPVRSAVLACGFGFGISVMASLLGVGEVILEQARAPALSGGGEVIVSGAAGSIGSARYILSEVLTAPPLGERIAAASPSASAVLTLVEGTHTTALAARGGIPSLERAIGDPETKDAPGWHDSGEDARWTSPDPGEVLRELDRFHAIPDVPERAASWAEWLYFNGRAGENSFYLTFLVGPRTAAGRRAAGVRLQLDRGGRLTTFAERAEVAEDELLASAPDLRIGGSRLRLEGMQYRADLSLSALTGDRAADLSGTITLRAGPGRSIPPFTIHGARGWQSGYVVPVLSGELGGALECGGTTIRLKGGTGYHDHNWGFWEGVSWQWGQVAGEELSFLYGRVHPPADAADPDRIPGFLAVLGPEGPLGSSTSVRIEETDDPAEGRPGRVLVRARSSALDLTLDLSVESAIRNPGVGGPDRSGRPVSGERRPDFLQLRGTYRVTGRVGERSFSFAAPGSAETFRGG